MQMERWEVNAFISILWITAVKTSTSDVPLEVGASFIVIYTGSLKFIYRDSRGQNKSQHFTFADIYKFFSSKSFAGVENSLI